MELHIYLFLNQFRLTSNLKIFNLNLIIDKEVDSAFININSLN